MVRRRKVSLPLVLVRETTAKRRTRARRAPSLTTSQVKRSSNTMVELSTQLVSHNSTVSNPYNTVNNQGWGNQSTIISTFLSIDIPTTTILVVAKAFSKVVIAIRAATQGRTTVGLIMAMVAISTKTATEATMWT